MSSTGLLVDEYVWKEDKENFLTSPFFSLLPSDVRRKFTRSSLSKISTPPLPYINRKQNHPALLRIHTRSEEQIRSRGRLWITTSRTLAWRGQKNPFSAIIGIRYVQGSGLRRNLLTLSVGNKRRGLKKLVEVTLNALTFMPLSPLLLCHLRSAHSVLFFSFSLMQFSTLPIHPSLCEALQKKIMAGQNLSRACFASESSPFSRGRKQTLAEIWPKLYVNGRATVVNERRLNCLQERLIR